MYERWLHDDASLFDAFDQEIGCTLEGAQRARRAHCDPGGLAEHVPRRPGALL